MTSWSPAGSTAMPPLEFIGLAKPGLAKEFRSLALRGTSKPKQNPDFMDTSALPDPMQQTDHPGATTQKVAELSEREAILSEEIKRLKDEIVRLTNENEASLRDLEHGLALRLAESMQADVQSSFQKLKEDLADSIAQVLRPFLGKNAIELAKRQFMELVAALVQDGKSAEMNIKAPEPFLQHLKHAFPEGSFHTHSADARFEISFGKEVISSRLDKWLETIEACQTHV